MQISELLVAAREAAGLTQAAVASARHVSRGAQSQLELTDARPAWDTIDSFAKAIDASVTITFELSNGARVSGRCAGNHRPTLADHLMADVQQARESALAAGWHVDHSGDLASKLSGFGEFATVEKLVTLIEPSNWNLQGSLRVLMSMAVAVNIETGSGSHFGSYFVSLTHPFDDDHAPTYDVTTVSQLALDALLHATGLVSRLTLDHHAFAIGHAAGLPVRGLSSFLATGTPGASEVAALMTRIVSDPQWRLRILREAGYLHGEPTPYEELPHITRQGA